MPVRTWRSSTKLWSPSSPWHITIVSQYIPISTHAHAYAYIYIYIYMYIYIYIYIYTYIWQAYTYIYIYSTSYSYQSLEQTTPVASKPANHHKSTHTHTNRHRHTHTELKWETLCRYNIQTPNAKNIIKSGANHGKKQTPKGQPSII